MLLCTNFSISYQLDKTLIINTIKNVEIIADFGVWNVVCV